MKKNYAFIICLLFLFNNQLKAQLKAVDVKIIDDLKKHEVSQFTPSKRSVSNPRKCGVDTVEFARYRGTAYFTVSVTKGSSLGQLYECPQPITLNGFSFYAFVIGSPPSKKRMRLICNVYNAGNDSLPTGSPLRSDTITIDSTFAGGVLSRIEKHATFKPLSLSSNYILTVETDSVGLSAGIVTNSYSAGNGRGHNLNCGSVSGLWYNGRNLNIGGVRFDCDILLQPHVKYDLGADFKIVSNCYNLQDSVKFANQYLKTVSGSRVYNRYEYFNLGYICHNWNLGVNQFQNFNQVNIGTKYTNRQNLQVRLISTIYGYRGVNNNGCSDTIIKDLEFRPETPSIAGLVNVCKGDSVKYTASSNDLGVVYEWLKTPNSTPFFTGKDYTFKNVSKNDTFYVRAKNKTCLSGVQMFVLKANDYPSFLTTKDDSVCSGSKANLTASSDFGNILWFNNINDLTPFFTGTKYQTSVLSNTTSFYVEANNFGCKFSPRKEIKVNVGNSFAPQAPVMSNDTNVCLSGSSALTLKATVGSGLTTRWYNAASGGSPISTNSTISFTPTAPGSFFFYADAFNGVCGSSREFVTVTVNDAPSFTTQTLGPICNGDSAILVQNTNKGTIEWFDANSGGNLLGMGNTLRVKPSMNTDYFVLATNGICVNPTKQKLTQIVNAPPIITKIWGDTICAKNSAKFRVVSSGQGVISWFDSDTSQTVLGAGKLFVSPSINSAKKYFAQGEYMGCKGQRLNAQPLVRAAPFSGFSFEILTWQQVRVSPINAGSSSIKWVFSDGFTSNQGTVTHRFQTAGTYNVKLILTALANGCKDSTVIPISIETSSLKNVLSKNFKYYPNPNQGFLNIETTENVKNSDLKMYDFSGRLIKTFKMTEDFENYLDVTDIKSGVYSLVLTGHQSFVIIKE